MYAGFNYCLVIYFIPLDIYRVILFVCEFLSTSGTAVSSTERVPYALTAEEVTAFCGNHEPSAIDNLKMRIRAHIIFKNTEVKTDV